MSFTLSDHDPLLPICFRCGMVLENGQPHDHWPECVTALKARVAELRYQNFSLFETARDAVRISTSSGQRE